MDSLTSITRNIKADARRAHDSLKRLLRRGFVEKVRRGWYRITNTGRYALLKLPVRNLSRFSQGKPEGTRVAKAAEAGIANATNARSAVAGGKGLVNVANAGLANDANAGLAKIDMARPSDRAMFAGSVDARSVAKAMALAMALLRVAKALGIAKNRALSGIAKVVGNKALSLVVSGAVDVENAVNNTANAANNAVSSANTVNTANNIVDANAFSFARPVYSGLFLDNVRRYAFGKFHQLTKDRVLALHNLTLATGLGISPWTVL